MPGSLHRATRSFAPGGTIVSEQPFSGSAEVGMVVNGDEGHASIHAIDTIDAVVMAANGLTAWARDALPLLNIDM